MAECFKCGSRCTSTQKAHTFVQMAGGQARGGVRKRITVLRMEALNEACPVPTIKQKALTLTPSGNAPPLYCSSSCFVPPLWD